MFQSFLLFLLFSFSTHGFSEETHPETKKSSIEKKDEEKDLRKLKILFDLKGSHQTGSHALLTAGELYEALLPHKREGSEAGDVLIRSSHMLLDIFLYYHFALVQHEILGHGARLREYDAKNIQYGFGLFHGWASGDFTSTHLKEAAFSAGGIEGSDIMSHMIDMDYLDSSHVETHKAFAHFFSFGNQGYYIHLFQDLETPGHDIVSYVNHVNAYAGSHLSVEKMRVLGIFDYLNPYIYYSVYSIGRYIGTGQNKFHYPTIPIAENLSYLPATRLVMAPHGPEIHLINYIRYHKFSGKVNLGFQVEGAGNGVSLNTHLNPVRFLSWLSVGTHLALWYQPEMTLGNFHSGDHFAGFLLNLKPSFQVAERFYIDTQVGFKTAGFVQGESLSSVGIIRLGLQFHF